MRHTNHRGEKSYTFTSFWQVSETLEINKAYHTEMEGEELCLITFAEFKRDQHNLCFLVDYATAANKNGYCIVVMCHVWL